MQDRQSVDAWTQVDYLIEAIRRRPKTFNLAQHIHWVGFQEIIPQYADLIAALEQVGVRIQRTALAPKQGVAYCVAVPDPLQALRIAAQDAKQCLDESALASTSTQMQLGIVIPDLAQQRDLVVRIFSKILPAGSFRVSGPPPLGSYPLIDAALFALSLAQGRISIEAISRLLRSPFFGDFDIKAMQERAAFDVYVRTLNEPHFSWEQLGTLAQGFREYVWWFSIDDCMACQADRLDNKKTSDWSLWIQRWLNMLGWPGTRALNETEKALVIAFETLLGSYTALESILALHTYEKMLVECKAIADSTLFLLSDIDEQAPIHVLGILEAAGLRFEKLWVLGMNHSQWPPNPEPNPFIPLQLQRQKNLPRSSVEREALIAQTLTEDFLHSADRIVFSYASMLDERVGHRSSLLKGLPERTLRSLGLDKVPSYLEGIAAYQLFDQSLAEKGPAIALPRLIKGGARALQLQSLCPFRAFAETRLLAKPLKICSLGLSASERGILVHKALECFWIDLKTQKNLLRLNDQTLRERLKKAIDKACNTMAIRHLRGLYRLLEEARLLERLYHFMLHEKNRPAFEVFSVESSNTLDCQGLQFKVRMDRIDQVEGLGKVLIDYKTAKTSVRDWFGPRPRDLQLPLYAVGQSIASATESDTGVPAALAFAGLHPHQMGFKGLASVATDWQGVKTIEALASSMLAENNWDQQWEAWKQSIESLASEFALGVARVDPLEGVKTCRHCSLKTLCRVQHT
jgi:ATP-dependent helicase/nuclease subunit B